MSLRPFLFPPVVYDGKEMKATIEPGFYYHYKHSGKSVGDYAYEVLNVAHHTEIEDFDAAAMVVYRPLYPEAKVYREGKRWDVRPLAMFAENVTKGDRTFPRFKKVTDPATVAELQKIRREMWGE
jgi:hypothetical protein